MNNVRRDPTIIAPIAIDVGAAHTGVFRAVYPQGTSVDAITERYGEVLTLNSTHYTLLMRDRTAKRHLRRCFDRRKMAKRLLHLILENYFDFPARQHAQALGFFLNRRGFTWLEETYNAEALAGFPSKAWDELPKSVQALLSSHGEVKEHIENFINNKPDTIALLCKSLLDNTLQPVKNDLFVLGYAKKLQAAVAARQRGDALTEQAKKEEKKLSVTPAWVLAWLIDNGVSVLRTCRMQERTADLLQVLNQVDTSKLAALSEQLESAHASLTQKTDTIWKDVKPGSFDLEKNADEIANPKKYVAAHLTNLLYAIEQANKKHQSGSRNRREYLEEIKADIESAKDHSHKYMQRFAKALDASTRLDADRLYRLIAHLSNLELKPLRAYFNDKAHKPNDQWLPGKLADIVPRWFLKQWRVSEGKDGKEKADQYKKLRSHWQQYANKNDIIAFWLVTDPELTIPPYQSQTNRHPPACQSLVLNAAYLNRHYPKWRDWLAQLDVVDAPDLAVVTCRAKSKKGAPEPLAREELRQARQLQFLLDRTQHTDPYKLNLIWSQYHLRQKHGLDDNDYPKADEQLNEHIAQSRLPEALKQDIQRFAEQSSFGHFINKYYQSRRKAKDGRYFLHPLPSKEAGKAKSGEIRPYWDDANRLLTLCSHRPRQKRHQMTMDFAAIVGMTPAELTKRLEESGRTVESMLTGIAAFKPNAENAAKAQKQYRGSLKLELQRASRADRPSKEQKKLLGLEKRIKELAAKLAATLWPELDADMHRARSERFNTFFSFAQIHNIVFKDRSGFSNTCPVCSTDNAGRMVADDNGSALASRLPALSVRLIDGAVKRLFEYKAEAIARQHWLTIEPHLQQGKAVRVPLILEQNRFEFEPSLAVLKANRAKAKSLEKERDNERDSSDKYWQKKGERIKNASLSTCPYTGSTLNDGGELDHIIPRASAFGTLNDEANLIYVSGAANRQRSNQAYYLKDLHSAYKQAQFDTDNDKNIRQWIYQTLTGANDNSDPHFVFGSYLSFINLGDDQNKTSKMQKAFRHALFLADDDPLKQLVIRSLQNRNRTFVNGTQRYFAQKIADKLHDRARHKGWQSRLSFDYFEYPADPRHPKGTQNLRRAFGIDKQLIQEDYSHHVDAHMVFLIAIDDHRDNGSLGVAFGDIASVWPFDDGDITAYKETQIDDSLVQSLSVGRKASPVGDRPHRSYYRDNFYADRYMPLWLIQGKDEIAVKKGFSPDNSVVYKLSKNKSKVALNCVARFSSQPRLQKLAKDNADWTDFSQQTIELFGGKPVYIPWARRVIEQHCVEAFSAKALAQGTVYSEEVELLRELAYQTQKKAIKTPEDINKALAVDAKGKGETRKNNIHLPARKQWQQLQADWKREGSPEGDAFQTFLQHWFLSNKKPETSHHKIRQTFSLPILNENAHYLQKRTGKLGEPVYQLLADSDSRKDGNKFKRAALTPDGEMVEVVNAPFRTTRMFKLKQDKVYADDDYVNIDPNRWYKLTSEMARDAGLDFPAHVNAISYLIDNVTRPKIKFQLDKAMNSSENEAIADVVLLHTLTKTKDKKETEKVGEKITQGETIIGPYVGSGFNQAIKNALSILFQPQS